MTVGEKLRTWREGKGLNQRDAAELANVSQAAWQAVERGRVKRIGLKVATSIVGVAEGAITLADFGDPGANDDSGPLDTESLHAKATG